MARLICREILTYHLIRRPLRTYFPDALQANCYFSTGTIVNVKCNFLNLWRCEIHARMSMPSVQRITASWYSDASQIHDICSTGIPRDCRRSLSRVSSIKAWLVSSQAHDRTSVSVTTGQDKKWRHSSLRSRGKSTFLGMQTLQMNIWEHKDEGRIVRTLAAKFRPAWYWYRWPLSKSRRNFQGYWCPPGVPIDDVQKLSVEEHFYRDRRIIKLRQTIFLVTKALGNKLQDINSQMANHALRLPYS